MFIALLIATTAAFILTSCGAQPTGGGGSANVPRIRKGPYLLYTGSSESMTIMWQTSTTPTTSEIYWGTSISYSFNAITTENSASSEYHQFSYTISGLTPDSKYFYKISMNIGTYESYFWTPPNPSATNLIFYAYGDSRSNPNMNNTIQRGILDDIIANNIHGTFVIHVGDFAAYGMSESYLDSEFFYRNHSETLSFESIVPVMYCVGNHDCYTKNADYRYEAPAGRLLRKYWPYTFAPTTERSYYSFEYGPVFVCILDQYTKTGYSTPEDAEQYSWATQEIESSTKSWKIAAMHEPAWAARVNPYPGDNHGNHPEIQEYYHPVFRDNTVEVVLEGHNHFYSRCETEEVTYLTVGGGGAPLHIPELSAENLITAESTYQYTKFSVSSNIMTVETFNSAGTRIDSFEVTP